jgi:hypothetical protein
MTFRGLLLAGVALSVASVAATVNTVSFRPGSPATVTDRLSHRIAAVAGTALIIVGATPLLFAPAQAILNAIAL